MRKLLTFVASLFITGSLLAGGLVTNNNQSVMFTRLQNRNASTSIDAAYFNPAGLTKLGNGFFASINNQTIYQTQKVVSNYQFLQPTPKEYVGKISAPVFPGIYLVYNTGKLSFSAGFNPIGGGGGAKYKTGLPSFEMPVSDIVPSLASQGIPTTQYSADIYFKGSSTYFGYQANVGYKINDGISVAVGARLVSASNKYNGYLKNISINPTYPAFGAAYSGGMVLASQFFTDGQTYLNVVSTQLSGTASSLQPIINGGGGSVPLSSGTLVGLTPTQVATLQGTIAALGGNPAGMTIAQSQAFFSGASATYGAKATAMGENAVATQDMTVDASESGTGITPILSANFSPSDMVDIAIKYEFKTKINLKTKVVNNEGGGIFVNGQTAVGDMPAMLSLGIDLKPTKKLLISGSFNEYFDKNVDYNGYDNEIDRNFLEFGLGLEYSLSEKLRVSAGWSRTVTGVNANYQSDQTFSTNTNSIGFGFGYRITQMIDLNLGYQRAFYAEGSKNFDPLLPGGLYSFETYNKSTWIVAAGLDFYFGKK
ncbi:MAG: aromatic hydrocarbon degradation protein [Bacteroidales bacterium]|jgi:long-subunit fatty acid transport protein